MKSLFIVGLMVIFCTCVSNPSSTTNVVSTTGQDELDITIREASNYLNGRIQPNSKTVFLNIQSNFPDLSEYIISVLSENAVNDNVFSVVDRQQLDIIRAELNFQLSGEVSDESAQSIGQMLGAQTIVSGTVTKIGALYRLQVKAIEVQTAAIQGQWSRNIPEGMTIKALTGNQSGVASTVPSSSRTTATSSVNTASTGNRSTPSTSIPIPSGLSAESINSTEIRLVWHKVETATSYNVYRSSSSGGTYTQIASTESTTYIDSSLNQNAAYFYRVSAVTNELEGRQSTTANARTPVAPVTPPGSTLTQQLAWIANQGGNGTTYEIVMNNDESMSPTTVSTRGRNITVIIRSENSASPKTIQLTGQGSLITVDANITLRLQDILLKGIDNNNRALVFIGLAGKMILDSGAIITGNTCNRDYGQPGGGVRVNGGVLEINEGAKIIRNNANNTAGWGGGGIFVTEQGNVIIQGGEISENVTTDGDGGGISIYNGTITMSGGIISKNRAYTNGGGVNIHSGNFTKRPSSGSDTSGIIYGNVGDNANTSSRGYAINVVNNRIRNTTLGYYDEISTSSNEGWGQ